MISQQQQLSQHQIFHMPASHANRRGEGLLIAVSNHLPYSATQWKKDTVNHIIWVTLTASSPQLPTLTIGACYIPPATSAQLQLSSVSDRFDTLTRHLRAATVASGHVILAGDFNAKVGNISDSWVTCFGDIPPHRLPTDPPNTTSMALISCKCARTPPWSFAQTGLSPTSLPFPASPAPALGWTMH